MLPPLKSGPGEARVLVGSPGPWFGAPRCGTRSAVRRLKLRAAWRGEPAVLGRFEDLFRLLDRAALFDQQAREGQVDLGAPSEAFGGLQVKAELEQLLQAPAIDARLFACRGRHCYQ